MLIWKALKPQNSTETPVELKWSTPKVEPNQPTNQLQQLKSLVWNIAEKGK